jgi:hypothetical protein
MAISTDLDISKKAQKYGAAKDVLFGVPESEEFDVMESVSQTASFGTETQLKNEVGITIGQVISDPKLEITMSGMARSAPVALGAVTELESAVSTVADPDGTVPDKLPIERIKFCIKQVKADYSNEDFVKFELNGEHYFNVDYTEVKTIAKGSDEHESTA